MMSASPASLPVNSLWTARARLDQVRRTCRGVSGLLAGGRLDDALGRLSAALREPQPAPLYGPDAERLDLVLAACVLTAELAAAAPRHALLVAEAAELRERALRRRIAALRGSA